MKSIIKDMKKQKRKCAALLLAVLMAVGANVQEARAETTTYTLTESAAEKPGSVTAKFTIGDTELETLGYTTTVSIPNDISLALSSGKFTGSDYIGVSGIINSSQTINVSIDTDNAAYKVIKGPLGYTKDLSALPSAKFSESLSKNGWSASETHENLEDKNDGKAFSAWSNPCQLSVSIDGSAFVPRYKGNYTTTIPLTIELHGA